MATATVTPVSNKGTAKKRVFNLDTFEKETKEVQYDKPTPLTSVDQVLEVPAETLLKVVNIGLEREAWRNARNQISGVSPKIINQYVNTSRMFMFTNLVEKDSEGNQTPDSRKKQTQAIYSFIRSNEMILNSLKEAAARSVDSDEDDSDEEEK